MKFITLHFATSAVHSAEFPPSRSKSSCCCTLLQSKLTLRVVDGNNNTTQHFIDIHKHIVTYYWCVESNLNFISIAKSPPSPEPSGRRSLPVNYYYSFIINDHRSCVYWLYRSARNNKISTRQKPSPSNFNSSESLSFFILLYACLHCCTKNLPHFSSDKP